MSKTTPLVIFLIMIGSGWILFHQWKVTDATTLKMPVEEQEESEDKVPKTVHLSPGIDKNIQIKTEPARVQIIQQVYNVPGRIQYDATKHIAIKSPTEGTIQKLLIKPGDSVKKGDLLAIIMSPEIGQARAEVFRTFSKLELENNKYKRETKISQNLQNLFKLISQNLPVKEIQKKLSDTTLGMYREKILSAYSTYLFKQELFEKVKPISKSGAIPERLIKQRESEYEIAKSSFRSVMDESSFVSDLAKQEAGINVKNAQRQFKIANQQLETLLGYPGKTSVNENSNNLSELEIRAPFSGTIEILNFAEKERVRQSDSMMILADTTELYVSADIRENDWSHLEVDSKQAIKVLVPAVSKNYFDAKVYYVGREVNQKSNSIPLIAIIDNRKKLFRPGMFVRVSIPTEKRNKELAVHPESVLQHESQKFVFVKVGERAYQRINVETGVSSKEWIEITKGLSLNNIVVYEGMFLLKSELLLEGEE